MFDSIKLLVNLIRDYTRDYTSFNYVYNPEEQFDAQF